MPEHLISNNRPVWAVVPAGGSGSRFSRQQDKLLATLAGRPVLVHTLQALLDTPSIAGIVLVSSAQNQQTYQALVLEWLPNAPIRFALGGATRRDSVFAGLLALPDTAAIVAVHDAARPLIDPNTIENAIHTIQQTGNVGAIVAVPIHDTVKRARDDNQTIERTVDRSHLWRAQTPQLFNTAKLLRAHRQVPLETPVTDDAQLLELANLGPVAMVAGDERNLKITTPTDLLVAEAFLQASRTPLV